MGELVPAVHTPIGDQMLIDGLRAAWRDEMGGEPTNQSIAVLAAQHAVECGRGGAFCWNWDAWNYKRYGDLDWTSLQTKERTLQPDGTYKTFVLVCLFAAYPDFKTACAHFIHNQYTRWDAAWTKCCEGDAVGYALALGAQHPPYYTADPKTYAAGCAKWADFYLGLMGGDSEPTMPEIQPIAFPMPDIDVTRDPPDSVPPPPPAAA